MEGTSCDNVNTFALIGPPSDVQHLYEILDWYKSREKRFSTTRTLLKLFEWLPPYKFAEIPVLTSPAGARARGLVVMCPILPEMIDSMEGQGNFLTHARDRVLDSCRLARSHGATIVGLGAFTSIAVVDREEELAAAAGLAVTSGNTLTAYLAVRGTEMAVEELGIDLARCKMAMIGGSGDIGQASVGPSPGKWPASR
jgi:predicted amino acid dehydrogenase